MAERALTAEEKADIVTAKRLGREMVEFAKSLPKSREASLAVTNAEQAVMWLVAAIRGGCVAG